ncbi:MAG: spermidine/putrescine transporter ATP-binding protein [Burkholderiales bacterium]|jgi:spermidine/putrescine transport system ATP-binding protein|nr:spermidine/putrescine transporter ATP-binding protein [Burkholderiales bacterium]
MPILEIQNVTKQFDDHLVVNNISLSVEKGEFFTLLGPSGCGKTTLLRMIAGLNIPDSGKIILEGQDITNLPPENRPLHTIFQSYALFPHMTVFENVAFPLKMVKWDKTKINLQVEELLEDVQLTKFAKRYPHELSGGQRQRVAIARSLVDRPKLLLLDEPLSALDANLREHMHVELVKLQEETGVTFVYVTHDQQEAMALSSRIAVLNFGEIEQLDLPQVIYTRPKTYFVADFLGKCNLLPAKVLSKDGNTLRLLVSDHMEFETSQDNADEFSIGQKGYYAIRPEKIYANLINPQDEELFALEASVKGYYYYGDATLYEFLINDKIKVQSILSNSKKQTVKFFNEGQKIVVSFDPHAGDFLAE